MVALLGLLPEEFAGGAGAANFAYYAPRCSYGSSPSRAMHRLAAAQLGQSELALCFFRETSATDLADTHAAIDGGIHIAALGGVWMIAVLGFAGLAVRPNGLSLEPRLPAGWTSLAFGCQWRGRCLRLRIDQGARTVTAVLEAGQPMTLTVQGKPHSFCGDKPLHVNLAQQGTPDVG